MSRTYFKEKFKYITEGFELFVEVFDLLLDNNYYNQNEKSELKRLRESLMVNRDISTKNHSINEKNQNAGYLSSSFSARMFS